jgi:hypothetical protein
LLTLIAGGCATPLRKLKPADLPSLPKSEGFYGGKMLHASTPWIYEGSTAKYHHFRYTYTRGNLMHSLRILVAKTDLRLSFEQPRETVPERGIKVELAWDDARFGYTFIKPITANPQASDWQGFPHTTPQFNQTLDLLPPAQKP